MNAQHAPRGDAVSVPDYLTYYFRDGQKPFEVLTDLDPARADDVCFTYPDSLYEVPLDDLGRLSLARNIRPTLYMIEELALVIRTYRVFEIHNHYIEAQIWSDRPLEPCADGRHWLRCIKR